MHADFEPLFANDAFLKLLGFSSFEEFAAIGFEGVIAPDARARLRESNEAQMRGEAGSEPQHAQLLHRNGDVVTVECRVVASSFDGRRCAAVSITDTTYRRQLEKQVSDLRFRYLDAELFAGIGYFRWHKDRNLIELSLQAQILLGLNPGASLVEVETFVDLFAGEHRHEIWSTMLAISNRSMLLRLPAVQTRDKTRFLEIELKTDWSQSGERSELFGLLHDITATHRQREALGLLARGEPGISDPFELAAKALVEGLGYRAAAVYRLSDAGDQRCLLACWVEDGDYRQWFDGGLEPGEWHPVKDTVCETIVTSRDIGSVADGMPEQFCGLTLSSELDIRACVGAPVCDRDGVVVGHMLAVDNKPDRLGPDHELVSFVADWIAQKLEQQRTIAQRDAEQRMWQTIAETMPASLFLKDRDGRLSYANRLHLELLGIPQEEVLGRTLSDRVKKGVIRFSEEDMAKIAEAEAQAWRSTEIPPMVRITAIDRSGRRHPFLMAKRQIVDGRDGQSKILTIGFDIADQVRAEQALRESEAHLRAILHNLPGAVLRQHVRRDGGRETQFVSERTRDLFDLDAVSELQNVGQLFADAMEPSDFERFKAESLKAYAAGKTYNMAARVTTTIGAEKWLSHRSHVIEETDDGWIVEAILLDETERYRAETALRESEAQFRALLANVPGAAWRMRIYPDEHRECLFASEGWEELSGWSLEELVQDADLALDRLLLEEDREPLLTSMRAVYQAGLPFMRTYRIRRKNGEIKWVTQRSRVVAREDGILTVDGLIIDDTEQVVARQQLAERDRHLQALQAELLQASRISAMGALSSAIAHEISQPLAAVSNYLSASENLLSAADATLPDNVDDYLTKARQQADRAGAVVSSLRRFFERGEYVARAEDINDVVEEALALALVDRESERASVHRVYGDRLPVVEIDRLQIQQVLLNLIRNAFQAMRDTRNPEIWIRTRLADDSVVVEVEDRGPGLPEDIADRIFDRFVTSRPEGMGMGLAICKSVLNAHDSTLEFQPCESGGTMFYFSLPVLDSYATEDWIQ